MTNLLLHLHLNTSTAKKEKQNRLNAKLMIDGQEHEEADDKVASLHDSHFDNVSHQFK